MKKILLVAFLVISISSFAQDVVDVTSNGGTLRSTANSTLTTNESPAPVGLRRNRNSQRGLDF